MARIIKFIKFHILFSQMKKKAYYYKKENIVPKLKEKEKEYNDLLSKSQ